MATDDSEWQMLEEAERASRARDLADLQSGRRTAAEINAANRVVPDGGVLELPEDLDCLDSTLDDEKPMPLHEQIGRTVLGEHELDFTQVVPAKLEANHASLENWIRQGLPDRLARIAELAAAEGLPMGAPLESVFAAAGRASEKQSEYRPGRGMRSMTS